MAGKIIVIEGTDCSGKETQTRLLEQKLKEKGEKCIVFDFPMYDTPTGKIVAAYLGRNRERGLFPEGASNVDPYVASLYYAADRKYNIDNTLKYLEDDYYVLLNRYTTSNLAHQGSKIQDKDERFLMYQWIDKLEYWLLKLPKPDKTIFLHMPYEFSLELQKNRQSLDEAEKSPLHLQQAELAYIELSELYNWDKVECVRDGKIRTIEDISDEVLALIEQ